MSLKRLAWWIPLVLTIAAGAYFVYTFVSVGIIPDKYLLLFAGASAVLAGLVGFLSLKWFKRPVVARIFAIVLAVLYIIGGSFATYVLLQGTSVLDGVSNNENAVSLRDQKSFNIYISGIDTYGDIAVQSRSDVNIVATVNPETHKILLTTIPRDSYVSIALGGNDQMDKLTHAGNYGVESSMKTVARLLDTDINAYVRINFTSFIESIDTLGGITINNPTAFSSNGQSFAAGEIQLNGKSALIYARERMSLQGGDVDRGKNQQRVIDGIIQKITSIRSIDGFNALLSMINTSVETNISDDTMKYFIREQVNDPVRWTTAAYSVKGKGNSSGLPSYAMPGSKLYMYVLDENSVKEASNDIRQRLDAR